MIHSSKERLIMLADCQSFYASVEKAAHPEYRDHPLAVAGDPARRSGIILAACPLAKSRGVSTAQRLGEALAQCPDLIVIKPRMQTYIDVSLLITRTLEQFSNLVEPFSIDEQFIDLTHSLALFGDAQTIARQIQSRVYLQTGVWTRIGISSTKILAKMACDIYAKKITNGIFTLPLDEVATHLWNQPVHKMFGVGSRMTAHFARMGISTIGDIARTPLPQFKEKMRIRMGKNSDIQAEVYWRTAHGYDDSPVSPQTHDLQQTIGHQMTLPYDYSAKSQIDIILLELSDEVCRRSRAKGYSGSVVCVGAQGADYDQPTGFYHQMKLPDPTNISSEVYHNAQQLFYRYWDGLPVRKIAVSLSKLARDDEYQLTLLDNRERTRQLEHVTDKLKNKYGSTTILRASSLLAGAQAKERSVKIGGHYK
jgi:DNA polymerase-4